MYEETKQAIAQVEANTDPEWREYAEEAVMALWRREQSFTTDQVWEELKDCPKEPHNRSAIGPVMLHFAGLGLIKSMGKVESKRRPRHNGTTTLWRPIRREF